MQNIDNLIEYFVFFTDKLLSTIPEIPSVTNQYWQNFRALLTQKNANVEKIKNYVKQMYDIYIDEELTENIIRESNDRLKLKKDSTKSQNFLKTQNSNSFLLKKKSNINIVAFDLPNEFYLKPDDTNVITFTSENISNMRPSLKKPKVYLLLNFFFSF